jgi:hypothetical protein
VRRPRPRSKAPLALAGFLALPLFFASLMAVSLAIEKPRVIEWTRGTGIARVFYEPAATLEAKIWLLSFVPALILVAAGYGACFFRYGMFATCGIAILEALLLLVRVGRWERHHTARFLYGEDLLSDKTNSSLTSQGQWEHNAAATVHSLSWYTIVLALVAALIVIALEWRRRRGTPVPPAGSELQMTGTAPTVSSA